MKYSQPAVIKVQVDFKQDIIVKDYTAKLVKSILIMGNPKLKEIFSKGKDLPPKPIHITPLYVESEHGIKAVYTKMIPKGSTARPPKFDELKSTKIKAEKKYFFYIGISLSLLKDVLLGLSNIGRFQFGKEIVDIDSIGYEIEYIDMEKESERVRKVLETEAGKSLKITFMSPTLLKDPLTIMRKKKKKLLLPLPEAIFCIPFFMILLDKGRLRRSIFLRCMRYVKSVFDIPYTALKTVNLAWYVYNNEVLPAMVGYVKYFIDKEVLRHAQHIMEMKYGLDFIELLSKVIVLAQVYGVGDGRATGFGHISIEIK